MKKSAQEVFDGIPDGMKAEADLWGATEDGASVSIPVYLSRPKKKDYNMRWLLLWQEHGGGTGLSMIEQAADKRLTLTDYRVRDYMLCKVGIGNFVHMSQREASEYLGIAQPNISASIKKLVAMGIVLEGPSKGRFRTYQINPALAFAGNLGKGLEARKEAMGKVIPMQR